MAALQALADAHATISNIAAQRRKAMDRTRGRRERDAGDAERTTASLYTARSAAAQSVGPQAALTVMLSRSLSRRRWQ